MATDKEILIAVREKIATGRGQYICIEIEYGELGNYAQQKRLIDWVQQMMGKRVYSYEAWLLKHHPTLYKGLRGKFCVAGRLQWLDWMIANCDTAATASTGQ